MNENPDDGAPLPEALIERLRAEMHPAPAVEERTIRALRAAGILGSHRHARTNPWVLAATRVAAAAILFAAGVLLGRRLPVHDALAGSSSLDVQEAGTAYVTALVRLSQAAKGDQPHNLAAGLEAGTATLRAAAVSLSQIAPGDPVIRRIRNSLDVAATAGSNARHVPGDTTIIRF